jgi:hypothetical protein
MSRPDFDVAAVFKDELAKAVADETRRSGFQPDEWFWSGRMDGTAAIEWWQEHGPGFCQNFIDWWEHNPDLEVWHTPDGQPAIELSLDVKFGSIPVRGYVDLVIQAGTALVVVDLKSGAKAPANVRQLAMYASAIELAYGVRPRYGSFFMARGSGRSEPKVFFQRPVDLGAPQYSIEYLTRELEQFERGIRAEVFPANPGENCGRCGVAYACAEVGGAKAGQLDPNYPKGWLCPRRLLGRYFRERHLAVLPLQVRLDTGRGPVTPGGIGL